MRALYSSAPILGTQLSAGIWAQNTPAWPGAATKLKERFSIFDLPDCYAVLKVKRFRQIDPCEGEVSCQDILVAHSRLYLLTSIETLHVVLLHVYDARLSIGCHLVAAGGRQFGLC